MERIRAAMDRRRAWAGRLIATVALLSAPACADPALGMRASWHKLFDPEAGVFVVAHRGCHNAAPEQHLDAAPENSLAALEHCVALGVDMMETDVRRTRDGALVIMHDETVDRTTNGSGRVSQLRLDQIKRLQLRQNFGSSNEPIVPSQTPPTLSELLAAARGRMLLNLDVKEEIYPQVVDAVLHARMNDQVIIKRVVTSGVAALADALPYRRLEFMPVVDGEKNRVAPEALASVVRAQASAANRIAAVEVISLSDAQFNSVRAAARAHHLRIWTNMLTSVGVLGILGHGGDREALREPDLIWGGLIDMGVSIFQTDEPAALLRYLEKRGRRRAPVENGNGIRAG